MKTIAYVLAAAVVMVAASALAGDKAKDAATPTSKKAAQSQKPKKVLVTGSYIKQDANQRGWTSTGMNNLVVLDSKMIQNSGASDLTQLLTFKGMRR